MSSDGGECIGAERNNTSGGSKENQHENKETTEVKEKLNDKVDRLTDNKEKLYGSKMKHNEVKDKNGSKDNINDHHEKQNENRDKVRERQKGTIYDTNKVETYHVENTTSPTVQSQTEVSGKAPVDKIIIRMSKDQSHNISEKQPHNLKTECSTTEPPKEKESKSELIKFDVPSAFESNLMQLYSSVKALKEAGRPIANTGNISRDEREGKHQCSEPLNSGNSNQPRYNDNTGRNKHHSSRSKSDSGHRSRHHDHSRDHRHDSKSHSHKHSCSRCHKRSKIKRASIGVQCRRDKTFEKFVCSSNRFESTVPMPRPALLVSNKNEPCKFSNLIRVETYPNGGASVVHLYQDEIQNLSPTEMEELVSEYFKVSYVMLNYN